MVFYVKIDLSHPELDRAPTERTRRIVATLARVSECLLAGEDSGGLVHPSDPDRPLAVWGDDIGILVPVMEDKPDGN